MNLTDFTKIAVIKNIINKSNYETSMHTKLIKHKMNANSEQQRW